MFDLEKEVSDWRRRMQVAGIGSPIPLDELEAHLRDEMEKKIRTGLSIQQAFNAAVLQIGNPNTLQIEFEKARLTAGRKQMLHTILILAALFGTVFGGAMVLPALGQWHRTGALHLWPLFIGAALVLFWSVAALFAIKSNRHLRGRKLIKAGIIAAEGFYVVPLVQAPFVQKTDLMGWMVCVLLAATSILFFGTLNRYLRPHSTCKH